jgi:mannose-6-phosphate isomerase-like protein (cupin superfamily)
VTGQGQRLPYILRAGEGDSVWSLGGHFTTKLTGTDAEGRFALVEALAYQSTEPPLHIHHREDEAWYILDGKLTFYVADQVIEAGSGCFVFAPRGVPHTFTVDTEPSRVLVFTSPAGFEQFALELGQPATNDNPPAQLAMPSAEVLAPVAERYGIEVVGPPRRLA